MTYGYQIYFSERIRNRVVRWHPDSGAVAIVAGDGATGPEDDQQLHDPYGLASDESGHLLISDKLRHRVVRLTNRLETVPMGNVEKAGINGIHRSRDMDRPRCPTGMSRGKGGSTVVAMSDDHSIRRLFPDGRMAVILGIADGGPTLFGDPPATVPEALVRSTPVRTPANVLERRDGSMIYIERGYQLVRQYTPGRGIISLFPIERMREWRGRRDAPAQIAMHDYCPVYPTALAEDATGALFLADAWHRCVWEVDLAHGRLSQVTTTSVGPLRGDGGPAAMACGPDGIVWVLDYGEGRVTGHVRTASGWKRTQTSCSTIYESVPCSAAEGCGLICLR